MDNPFRLFSKQNFKIKLRKELPAQEMLQLV